MTSPCASISKGVRCKLAAPHHGPHVSDNPPVYWPEPLPLRELPPVTTRPPHDPHAAEVISEAFDRLFRTNNGGLDDIIRMSHRTKARVALEALRNAGYVVVFAEMDGM